MTYVVGKFAHSLDINVCRFHSTEKRVSLTPFCEEYSETGLELCWGTSYRTASLCTLSKYLVYNASHADVSVVLKIYCIDTSNPWCPCSNRTFTHFIWNSFAFYFMGYAIAVVPCSTSGKVMFLCHYSARSNSCNSHRCGEFIKKSEGIQ